MAAAGFASGTPASPVPASRWGTLRPAAILGDFTSYEGHVDPKNGDTLQWNNLDIENGFLFTATGQGMQIFDLRTSPGNPGEAKSYIYGWISGGAFPSWDYSDKDWYIKTIDAPPGVDHLLGLGMEEQGFAIVNATDKSRPVVAYQGLIDAGSVFAFSRDGVHQAFVLDRTGAISRFSLSAAAGLNRCLEGHPDLGKVCPGVFQGRTTSFGSVSLMHGAWPFLATATGGRSGAVSLWDVSNPASPVKKGEIAGLSSAIALWGSGGSYHLARLGGNSLLQIYDVSCIAAGGCASAPAAIASKQFTVPVPVNALTVSADAGRAYLYVGSNDFASCVPQREFFFDVSVPSAPTELTPPATVQEPGGYWGWYYSLCPTGFNLVAPFAAKVHSGYLYRAANSILDAHRIEAATAPGSAFTWTPSAVYPGTPVNFVDQSTGTPTAWSWTFQDATPGSAATQNPTAVLFASPGSKTVTLRADNAVGDGTVATQQLAVLNPVPAIGSLSVSPSTPLVCQKVTVSSTGVTGQPTLAYFWNLKKDNATDAVPAPAGTTTPAIDWQTLGTTLAGSYTANLLVSNGAGTANASATFTLGALPGLPVAQSFAPGCTNCTGGPPPAPVAGTAAFTVSVPGATEWSWDFGDGQGFRAWTADPVSGPAPSASYLSLGNKTVRVKVRNCTTDQAGIESAPLVINIVQIEPLTALFDVPCPLGFCGSFVAGAPFDVTEDSSGPPDKWEFDWNNDGTIDETFTSRPTKPWTFPHTYANAGTYRPRLKVWRGTESNEMVLGKDLFVSAPNPPSISLSGPASGDVSQSLSFSASANNCTPAANGWTWSTGGGSGSSSSASISITWSSSGTKFISASNSACGSASGSLSVTIGSTPPPPPPPPPPPGNLSSKFTYSPSAPKVGQAVSFDGSTSTGSPAAYTWEFGDGTSSTTLTTPTVSHTFAKEGAFTVTLSVGKADPGCSFGICSASSSQTVTVVSGLPPLVVDFSSNATCEVDFVLTICRAAAGQKIDFQSTVSGASGPIVPQWSFGDGGTASGATATHTYKLAQSVQVTLTVTDGARVASKSVTFVISAPPATKKVAVAWIAQTQKPVVQTSDLFVNNPSDAAMTVDIFFRKRGVPEANPPKQTRVIPARGTSYIADVLGAVFARPEQSGFIVVEVKEGTGLPIVTSFNTTFDASGNQFGQTLSGVPFRDSASEASTARTWHVVGLNDDLERDSYFGLSNAGAAAVTMKLRVFDRGGDLLGRNDSLTVSGYGQKQFSLTELRDTYGVGNRTDWRVEVEPAAEAPLIVYGANRRIATKDTSSLGGADGSQQRVYLLGAIDGIGLQDALWQSDLVLANPAGSPQRARVTFSEVGLQSTTSAPVFFDLAAGESRRITDVITATFGRTNKVGLLTIDGQSSAAPYLVAQGESYNNADPAKRFGQTLPPIYDEDAATAGHSMNLVGLRQDADYRVTMWIANVAPAEVATMGVVYRDLAGNVVQRIDGFSLAPGRLKQFPKSAHPSVAGGRFTVGIEVLSGKVIAGAQVVNNKSNDPAYVKGQANK